MKKLKKRWKVETNRQLFIILLVFSITGSAVTVLNGLITSEIGITKEMGYIIYWCAKILVMFPLYQIFLLFFGWIFGEFKFFWNFEKKMLNRMASLFIVDKS